MSHTPGQGKGKPGAETCENCKGKGNGKRACTSKGGGQYTDPSLGKGQGQWSHCKGQGQWGQGKGKKGKGKGWASFFLPCERGLNSHTDVDTSPHLGLAL